MPLSSLPAPTDTSFSGTQTSQPHSNEPRPSIAPSRSTFGSSHSASARLTSASIDPGPPRPTNQPKGSSDSTPIPRGGRGVEARRPPNSAFSWGGAGPKVSAPWTLRGHLADTSRTLLKPPLCMESSGLGGIRPGGRTAVPTFSRIGATTRQAPTALDEKRWCISRQPGERLATPSPRPEFESQ